MRYSVGDIAIVRSDLKTGIRYSNYDGTASDVATIDMINKAGKEVIISLITSNHKYRVEGSYRVWTDEMFEDHSVIPDISDMI